MPYVPIGNVKGKSLEQIETDLGLLKAEIE